MPGFAIWWTKPATVACALTACLTITANAASAQSFFTGTATYRERMTLPAGAVLEVTLEDVSRADAPAETIAAARVESPGPPPISFKLVYDQRRIVSNRRYVVRARIVAGGELLFTTDTAVPALSANAASPVALMMRRVSGRPAAPLPAGLPLVGTYWRAIELAGKPVPTTPANREAHLLFATGGRVGGSDGCNRINGGYELTGDRMTFRQIAATQMACLNPPGTERPFRDALAAAARFTLTGDRLELFDGDGVRRAIFAAAAEGAAGVARDPLSGTSWRLVRFQGSDGAVLTPDDRSKYTLEFDAKGGVAARIDCNRGRGTWTSSGANQVRFGPLALTRAQCPPGSLHDQVVRQWGNVRSYVMNDGRLFLSLMADGGIYEFEPAGTQETQPGAWRSPVRSRGPATWTCTRTGAAPDVLRVTLYDTQPALAVLERGGVTRHAFQVRAASGVRYEGDGVLFWEARGEATIGWMGLESTCKPN